MVLKKRTLSSNAKDELDILRQLLDPAVYKDFKARNVQWGIFKRLRKKYEPLEFWRRVKPVIPLDNLLYFYGHGAEALHEEWRQYITFLAVQRMEELTQIDRNVAILERMMAEQDAAQNPLDTAPNPKRMERKKTALEWADS